MSLFLRDIRASYDSKYFGATLEKETISIWKSDTASPVATVRPGFSGGANRHAIDPVNQLIYSGTWEDGLTCFDYANNRPIWHRDDLIGIQTVNLSAGFPSTLFVTLEAPDYRLDEPGVISGIVELDARDSTTHWITEQGDWVYTHPSQPLLVTVDRSDKVVRILDGEKTEIGSTPMNYFAILDVAFNEELIALAEGKEGVRIVDHKGVVISQYAPKDRQANCLSVTFAEDRLIVFDSWDESFVTMIDPHTGKLIAEYERESDDEIYFIDNGSRFVDSDGQIYRSIDGQLETKVKAE